MTGLSLGLLYHWADGEANLIDRFAIFDYTRQVLGGLISNDFGFPLIVGFPCPHAAVSQTTNQFNYHTDQRTFFHGVQE
jgi:hypothetical protein